MSERFNYMMLTDYEGEELNDGTIVLNDQPPTEEFLVEDDLEY